MQKDQEDKVNDKLEALCKEALSVWGPEPQVKMAIEEMAELIKALLKIGRVAADDTDDYIKRVRDAREEVADVKIMMKQMEELLDNIGTVAMPVSDYMEIKVTRLDQRLEKHRKEVK